MPHSNRVLRPSGQATNYRIDRLLAKVTHESIAERYNEKKKRRDFWSQQSRLALRIAEIETVLWDRYPDKILPDDDAGHDDLRIVLHHMARYGHDERTMMDWIIEFAPSAYTTGAAGLIYYAIASKKKIPRADTLARFLGLTFAVRQRLGITTIGAIDVTKRRRSKRRRGRKLIADAVRVSAKRRADGATPHAESLSQTRPWEAENIGRRQWERRRKTRVANADVANSSDSNNGVAVMVGDETATPERAAHSRHRRTNVDADIAKSIKALQPKVSNRRIRGLAGWRGGAVAEAGWSEGREKQGAGFRT